MHCSCPTTTLRIFVRNIAKLQLEHVSRKPASPKLLRTSKQFSQLTYKGHRAATTVSDPSSTTLDRSTLHGIKSLQKSTKRSITTSSPDADATTIERPSKVTAWSVGDETNAEVNGELQGTQNYLEDASSFNSPDAAVLEITSESIDTLAAESLSSSALPRSEHSVRGPALRPSFQPGVSTSIRKLGRDPKAADRRPATTEVAQQTIAYPPREPWQIQKAALKEKFAEGWNPRKRLSPDALKGIKAIHAQYPHIYTTDVLAKKFEVSPEAIRRILKSKWKPNEDEEEDRNQRWHKRGTKVWSRWAELGVKPPARWRREGVGRVKNYRDEWKQLSRGSTSFQDQQPVEPVGGSRRQRALANLTTEHVPWAHNTSN